MPEGIRIIEAGYHPFDEVATRIYNQMKGKVVIFPDSLKEVHGFAGDIKGVILNDGLEYIGKYGDLNAVEECIIPSSLKTYNIGGLDFRNTKTIIFKDYKKSPILNSPKRLGRFLCDVLYADVIKIKQQKKEGQFVGYKADVKLVPRKHIDYLILEDNNGERIVLSLKDIKFHTTLECLAERRWAYVVGPKEVEKYVNTLLRIIKKIELEKENKKLVK